MENAMMRCMIKSKIHRATVTEGNINYNGSITIDKKIMIASNILPYEYVHINNLSNAAHWETYAIAGNDGEIILNGPPARIFQKGDKVVILSFAYMPDAESKQCDHTNVFVDHINSITEINVENNKDWND